MITATEFLCSSTGELELTLEHRTDDNGDERWIVGLSSWGYFRQYFKEEPARKMYSMLARQYDLREPNEWEHNVD